MSSLELAYENEKFIDAIFQGDYFIAISDRVLVIWKNWNIFYVSYKMVGKILLPIPNSKLLNFYLLEDGYYKSVKWNGCELISQPITGKYDIITPIDDRTVVLIQDKTFKLVGYVNSIEYVLNNKIIDVKVVDNANMTEGTLIVTTSEVLYKCVYKQISHTEYHWFVTELYKTSPVNQLYAAKDNAISEYVRDFIDYYDDAPHITRLPAFTRGTVSYRPAEPDPLLSTTHACLLSDAYGIILVDGTQIWKLVKCVNDRFLTNHTNIVYMLENKLYLINETIRDLIRIAEFVPFQPSVAACAALPVYDKIVAETGKPCEFLQKLLTPSQNDTVNTINETTKIEVNINIDQIDELIDQTLDKFDIVTRVKTKLRARIEETIKQFIEK